MGRQLTGTHEMLFCEVFSPPRRLDGQPVGGAGQLLILVGQELSGTHLRVTVKRLLAVDDPALECLKMLADG